jgi:CheY-like chemotaxis protein
VRLEPGDRPLVGRWDAGRLDQVVANLLSNAIKYSPDGGEITIRAEQRGSQVEVSVQDQGLGIEPGYLPKMFDRFYRANTTASGVKGLGVGLYIARELIEAHGGRIWAESAGPGRGSTFWFTLPLASSAASSGPGAGPVLVVDDDEPLREVIVDALRGEGYRVVAACDGLEALERLEGETPALILLDWMMPLLDGEGFAAELRRLDRDIPIVVMTAGVESRGRAARIGAVGYLNKPFELAALLDQVAHHVATPTPAP